MTTTPPDDRDHLLPWLAPLSAKSRAAVAAGIADWPPLTDRQRERLTCPLAHGLPVGAIE